MKTKNKLIAIALVAIMIFSIANVGVFAANEPMEIKVSSAECIAGSSVSIDIDLVNNPGISSLRLKVAFDEILTLKTVEYNTEMGGQTIQPQKTESPVTLMWVSPFTNFNSDATFATLTFEVSETAPEGSIADITITYDPNDIYNMDETNVDCIVTNGAVSIPSVADTDKTLITPTEYSTIDYENKYIFYTLWASKDLDCLVNYKSLENLQLNANERGFIETGSTLTLTQSTRTSEYKIIVVGDVNGDSSCDVIDAALVELGLNNHIELSDDSKLAATRVIRKDIEISDYQNIINWILSGKVEKKSEYTVTFKDYDGTIITTESVDYGESATPPSNPLRAGFIFTGWDKSIDNITTDTVITAEYIQISGPTFIVEHVNASAGAQNVAVTISLANNPGIASIGMYVKYDSNLTLTGIEYNSAMGGQSVLPQNYSSPAKLTWVSPFENTTEDKIFATLYFNVSDTATGELPIEITYNADDVYDMTENNIAFNVVNNAVLVTK